MANWETVCELGARLPEVEQGTWYGTPALKVSRQGFARLREDGALVVMIDVLEREALMQEDPETFYITPHYQDYPAMLDQSRPRRPRGAARAGDRVLVSQGAEAAAASLGGGAGVKRAGLR